MRRGVLGELGPDRPVTLAGPFDTAVNEMAGDRGEDDRMPAHHVVLPVFRHQVEKPGNRGGFPSLAARRLHVLRPAQRHVLDHRRTVPRHIELEFE